MLKIHIEMRTLVQLFTASSSSGHVPKNNKPASAVSLEGAGNSNKSEKTASFRETGLYFQMSGTLLLKVLWCRHKTRDKDSFCRNKSFKIWKQKISQKLNDKSLNYKISGIWLSDWQARLGLLLGGSDNHSDSCAPAGRKAKSAIVFTINTVCLPAQRDIVSLGATSPIMQ